ncbi:MAG: SapC family protein [Pelagimonas sp.]|jgi:hypothetical protein|nr:SapC family protein [Pelagimonas sp.]
MTQMPLFFSDVTVVSSEDHRSYGIQANDKPLAFAQNAQLIPALFEEFAAASNELPIVFAPTGTGFSPVFLCSLATGKNSFVDSEGRWTKAYVPAYLRRYPFILGEQDQGDAVVCIDQGFEGFAPAQEGQEDSRLFDDEGVPTAYLERVIALVRDYAAAAQQTEQSLALLAELNLFRQIAIEARDGDGEVTNSLQGFAVIDEGALNALSNEDFLRLRGAGVLPAIYAHLLSVALTRDLGAQAG